MIEEWRDIEGYEGLYQVSNLGRVKSLERVIIRANNRAMPYKEQILKNRKTSNGYLYVSLYKNKQCKNHSIHRLVAQSFIENPNNYEEINHIDENKTNNNVVNLEWCTRKQNMAHGNCRQRIIESNSKPIYCLELDKFYKSATECARELNIDHTGIGHVLRKDFKQYKNLTFFYVKDIELGVK